MRLDATVQYRGALTQQFFESLPEEVFVNGAEFALRGPGLVINRHMRRSRRFRDRNGNLRRSFRVRGSRYLRQRPSARIAGAPHFPLVEYGHRAHGPVGSTRFGAVYGDTGKQVRGRFFLRRAQRETVQKQERAFANRLENRLAKTLRDAQAGKINVATRSLIRARSRVHRDRQSRRLRGEF